VSSYSPINLFVVLDDEQKLISIGAVKRELIHMVDDNPGKNWKVYRMKNNDSWYYIKSHPDLLQEIHTLLQVYPKP
jgi:hypothetical protein